MLTKFFRLISYFFHPINFSIVGAVLYFLFIPRYIHKQQEHLILIVIFAISYVFPIVLLFLLKKFKMIQSYYMESIEERKFPTLLFISLTFIIGNWLYKSNVVDLLSVFYFGYGIALILSYILLLINIKISLHAVAVAGLIGFLMYFSYFYQINLLFLIAPFIFLSGLIVTARLKLEAHKMSEVIYGYSIGLLSQIIYFTVYYNI